MKSGRGSGEDRRRQRGRENGKTGNRYRGENVLRDGWNMQKGEESMQREGESRHRVGGIRLEEVSKNHNGANWLCNHCFFDNFPSHKICHKCKVPKLLFSGNSSSILGTAVDNSTSASENYSSGNLLNIQKNYATKGAAYFRNNQNLIGNFRNSNKNSFFASNVQKNVSRGAVYNSYVDRQQISNHENKKSLNNIRNKTDCETFIRSLSRINITSQHIEDNISLIPHVWFMCWENIDQFPPKSVEIMITALAKISYSVIQSVTPSIMYCRMGVKKFLLSVRSLQDTNLVLNKVEIVFNMIKKLIGIEWKEEKEIVKNELKAMLSLSINILDAQLPDHKRVIKSIMNTLDSLEKPWSLKQIQTLKVIKNATSFVDTASESSSWQNVNVSWLAKVELFQPALLPAMKVPSNKSGGVYKDSEEYFDIVMRLWIGLTFSYGNSHLNPKCRHKFGEKECGEVMLPNKINQHGSNLYCLQTCQSPVVLHCPDSRHNKGLCVICAKKAKTELMGPAGPHASTNIYDCQVTRVKDDGRIYMNTVESRKPPYQNAIHWKSTRRLCSANLVGLIKLSNRGSCLKDDDIIIWGEVINHGEPRDEFRRREEKRLCISLSTINGTTFTDLFKEGDYLAVIDCMTFVPEHIPILKALDIQKASILPFQEGALLNIGKQKDITNFDGFSHKLNNLISESTQSLYYPKLLIAMSEMIVYLIIDQSQLDPIIRIRRDEVVAAKLRQKLTSLVSSATLDNKQLQSFAEAFVEPVHLTQGPPGTGKSYLGVVIVQALLIIQELWNSVDSTVGMRPILVLSYKNHAIDEFLTDLVKAEHHVNLIRIGNSDEPALHRYSEKNFQSSDFFVDCIKNELQVLLKQKEDYQHFQKSLSPLLAYEFFVYPISHDQIDENDKKIASYNAALFLHNLIVNVKQLTEFLNDKDIDEFEKLKTVWDDMMSEESKKILNESDIQNLWNGIKHYNDKMDFCDVILNFINGVKPLPKCSFNNYCNNMVCSKTISLCYEHKCKHESCCSAHLESHLLCKEHACQAYECKMVKLSSPQVFCKEHACFVCLKKNLVANKCIDSPPRNSCLDHPLCTFKENNQNTSCVSLALSGKFYCKDHINKVCSLKECNQFAFSHLESNFGNVPLCHNHKWKFESSNVTYLENSIMPEKLVFHVANCNFVKIPPQVFCKEHACFICLKENLVSCSIDIAPRNTCSKHLLCVYMNQNKPCMNLALSNAIFCESHYLKYCLTSNCKKVALSQYEPYCETHKPKCIFKRRNGEKCDSDCIKGFAYCYDHVKLCSASPTSIIESNLNDQTQQINNIQYDGSVNATMKSKIKISLIDATNKVDHKHIVSEMKDGLSLASQNEVHYEVPKNCLALNIKKEQCKEMKKQDHEYFSDHVKKYYALPINNHINSKVEQTDKSTIFLTENANKSEINTHKAYISLVTNGKYEEDKDNVEKFNTEFKKKGSKNHKENKVKELFEINNEFKEFYNKKHEENITKKLEEIGKNYFSDNLGRNDDSVDTEVNTDELFIEESFDKIEYDDDINDEPANYQHLRDVYFEDEKDDNEIEEEETPQINQVESNKTNEIKPLLPPEKWSWEMSLEDRWHQCKLLEKEFSFLLLKLEEIRNFKIKILRKNYYEEKMKAKTRVYERKAVIGGTIVGCIARLEAIRSTKPFAILVEEASEVLEPLVFSCLTDTTCK
ncbi:uncharacterized protein LOC136084819 [Hydra vulgaris]|uniref:Uncharacterized protein LOC136084819 n=1 Tax=Hydra vulgaris TaxID=6087 RepID=A0ABM4CJL2_HYDVU